MSIKELIADSRVALVNQQYDKALQLAKKAIKLESGEADAHKCAGAACMVLKRHDEAIHHFKNSIERDISNGNRYFDLGYAYAHQKKMMDALKNFARAEELGCTPETLVQLYNLLGMVCFELKKYDDALIHFSKVEKVIGVDMDIMHRKAIIYGLQKNVRKGLMTSNQMKLLAPSEYRGYQMAFNLLILAKRLEDADRELEMAARYTEPSAEYYFDCLNLELEKYKVDHDKGHYEKALSVIEESLKVVKPTVKNVLESYINAAEIYVQMENPQQAIHCLHAAQNPIGSFNNEFEIIYREREQVELTDYDLEDMMQEEKVRIEEEYGDYGIEELAESVEPDEDGNRDYFTYIEDEPEQTAEQYVLDEAEEIHYSDSNIDQINRLYVGAYTLLKDFNKVREYAKKMQSSNHFQYSYAGTYAEANAMKELGEEDSEQKYHVIIKFFKKAMMKDPSDLLAVSFRVQCLVDIGQYDEAEQLCSLLSEEMRGPMLAQIQKEKEGGD